MANRSSPDELELVTVEDSEEEEADTDSEEDEEEGFEFDSAEEEEEAEIDGAEEAEFDDDEEAEFDSEYDEEFDSDVSEFDGVEYTGEDDLEFDSLEDYGSEEDDDEEEEESDSESDDEDYEPLGEELVNGGDSGREKRSRTEEEEEEQSGSPETSSDDESDLDEVDGLICPICSEPWTTEGDHRVCCLPCGHLYGLSCISKWLVLHEEQGKCPQCNRECSLEDVRKLFASQVVAIDEKLQKRIQSLEAKCDSLQKQKAKWKIKEINWKKLEANWGWERQELMKPRPVPPEFMEYMTSLDKFVLEFNIRIASLERNSNGQIPPLVTPGLQPPTLPASLRQPRQEDEYPEDLR